MSPSEGEYEAFCAVLSKLERCRDIDIRLDASLAEDYGFDSLDMLSAITLFEESCGMTEVDDSIPFPILNTVQDLFAFYVEIRSRQQ